MSPKPKSENCYICGKEFLLSSLKIHEKQCAKKHEIACKNKSTPKTNKTAPKVSKKLQLEACYLCGKEFFVHSLGIHETQCIKNWKANKTPDANDQTVSERAMMEKQRNNMEGETEAQNSGRKQNISLNSDLKSNSSKRNNHVDDSSVQKEQKSNKKEQMNIQKPSPKLEKSDSPKPRGLKTIPCYLCGVAFLPHSLKIHEKKCRSQYQDGNAKTKDDDGKLKDVDKNSAMEEKDILQDETDPPPNNDENIDVDSVKNSFKTPVKKKPKTIVCYICGQEFLKSSYAFHEKKCASMNESIPSAKAEETTTLEKPKVSNTRNSGKPRTIICYICGGEFLKSSYQFHERKCSKIVENSQDGETDKDITKSDVNQVKKSPKPRTIVCYICGGEFLKSSYAIHEKQCALKNKKVEDLEQQNEKTTSKRDITNKEESLSEPQMERPQTPRRGPKTKACYICGKEVLVSSLKVHEQQCQKKTDILKNINQQKSPGQARRTGKQSSAVKQKAEVKPKTDLCYICGETFLSSSIKVHEIQCEKRWNEKTRS